MLSLIALGLWHFLNLFHKIQRSVALQWKLLKCIFCGAKNVHLQLWSHWYFLLLASCAQLWHIHYSQRTQNLTSLPVKSKEIFPLNPMRIRICPLALLDEEFSNYAPGYWFSSMAQGEVLMRKLIFSIILSLVCYCHYDIIIIQQEGYSDWHQRLNL